MSGRRADALGCVVAAAASCLVSLLVLRPWRGDLDVPYSYSGDGSFYHTLFKAILEHGWYFRNPDLGAPAGQQLHDYPALNGDTLNVLVVKLAGLFTSDAAVVMNLFFLVTFPLVALSAYLVLRRLGLSVGVALVCSSLYALLPFHFVRGEGHLLLSAYYAVPLGAYLALSVLTERPLFARRLGGRGVLAFASRRTFATLALCLVVASASASFYYSAFTVLLVAFAAALRSLATLNLRPLLRGGAVIAAILALSALALAPSIAYSARHGTNEQVGQRKPLEAELYGLKLAQLVLPLEQHRIDKLARMRQSYDRWSLRTEATVSATLGAVTAAGFLWLLAVALIQLAGPARRLLPPLHTQAAVVSLVALFLAWSGGFATLMGVVQPQIRSWNRLSIFIAFYALLAVGLLLDRAVAWLRPRRAGGLLAGVALAAVFALGVLDQTSDAFAPPYDGVEVEYRSDERFVRGIEQRLAEGAMVYQLPFLSFPEKRAPVAMADYDPLRGFLHSDDLRWSYGAMRGRAEDRFAPLAAAPVAQVLPAVASAGFQGVWVDRAGYEDGGAQVERELAAAVGPAALVSDNGRFSFFDLRRYTPS